MKITHNLTNGRWEDENDNSWPSEDLAVTDSPTLINCHNCHNCHSCHNCDNCNSCINCHNCINYDDCHSCNNCNDCNNCHNCDDCNNCHNCNDCNSCDNCRNCNSCDNCHNCISFKTNPARLYSIKIGSRNSQTIVYWLSKNDVVIICGCFTGNLEEFELKVNKTYPDNGSLYKEQYLKLIKQIKMLID